MSLGTAASLSEVLKSKFNLRVKENLRKFTRIPYFQKV